MSKLMAIRKRGKPPDSVKKLRAVQILPTNVRLIEQAASDLKSWLVSKLENQPELYAFLQNKSTSSLIRVG